eukprot:m.131347 g.131347  ORF g.131347 m.131347 type:complete len:159 (+) comp14625_c0_seq5:268-744(+)
MFRMYFITLVKFQEHAKQSTPIFRSLLTTFSKHGGTGDVQPGYRRFQEIGLGYSNLLAGNRSKSLGRNSCRFFWYDTFFERVLIMMSNDYTLTCLFVMHSGQMLESKWRKCSDFLRQTKVDFQLCWSKSWLMHCVQEMSVLWNEGTALSSRQTCRPVT